MSFDSTDQRIALGGVGFDPSGVLLVFRSVLPTCVTHAPATYTRVPRATFALDAFDDAGALRSRRTFVMPDYKVGAGPIAVDGSGAVYLSANMTVVGETDFGTDALFDFGGGAVKGQGADTSQRPRGPRAARFSGRLACA